MCQEIPGYSNKGAPKILMHPYWETGCIRSIRFIS